MFDSLSLNTSPSMAHTGHSGCCYVLSNDEVERRPADAPEFLTDDFRMHHFKIDNCQKQQPHDWTTCPFAHAGEKARRRDPACYKYAAIACIDMKNNGQCPRGDDCPYAHNVFEYWMHPTRYRTQVCNDGTRCKRQICFFAHRLDELRVPPRKPGFPPEWHKGRKHKNRSSGRKSSSSPKTEDGKGVSEPVALKTGWHDPLYQENECLRKACLNNRKASMDRKDTGYATHDLVSVSQKVNDALSPFNSIQAVRDQSMADVYYPNNHQCSALLNDTQTTQALQGCASNLEKAISVFQSSTDWSTGQLTQSSSEYAAYAPLMHTALGGTHRMNPDVERQRFALADPQIPSVVDTTTYNSSLSPPRHVRFSPEITPFPGMGSDQDSPLAPPLTKLPELCFAQNPLNYNLLFGECLFPDSTHESTTF